MKLVSGHKVALIRVHIVDAWLKQLQELYGGLVNEQVESDLGDLTLAPFSGDFGVMIAVNSMGAMLHLNLEGINW